MEKLGSWFLLMIISVVLVTIVHPPRAVEVATPAVDALAPARMPHVGRQGPRTSP